MSDQEKKSKDEQEDAEGQILERGLDEIDSEADVQLFNRGLDDTDADADGQMLKRGVGETEDAEGHGAKRP